MTWRTGDRTAKLIGIDTLAAAAQVLIMYIPAASGVMHKATDLSSTSLAQFTLVYKRVNSANIGSPCTAEY